MKPKNLLVTGASGFLGRHVVNEFKFKSKSIENIFTFRSSQYDLRCQSAANDLLNDFKPDTIIHCAATVGGIGANMKNPGQFFYDNIIMGVNLIEAARRFGVKKFVNICTICAYPKDTPVPFREEDLWNGYPEETNAPYGLAKKSLIVQLQAYKQQYDFNGINLLLVNLYGPGDNFDLDTSHVIPAMIRKFYTAKARGDNCVTLWGDGTATREFLFVEDAARAIRLATERYDDPEPVNIGTGREISMKDLAKIIKEMVNYQGEIVWDTSKPNGQPRRCLDVRKAQERFNFKANIMLRMGLEITYKWFLDNIVNTDGLAPDIIHSSQRVLEHRTELD